MPIYFPSPPTCTHQIVEYFKKHLYVTAPCNDTNCFCYKAWLKKVTIAISDLHKNCERLNTLPGKRKRKMIFTWNDRKDCVKLRIEKIE